MWYLVDNRDLGGREDSAEKPLFLDALQAPLTVVAAKYALSSGYSEFPKGVDLLWCTGLVASDFLDETGVEPIELWRAEEDRSRCWDINMKFDEVAKTIHVDFEGESLLHGSHGLRLYQLPVEPESLALGADVEVAASNLGELLDQMLGSILKTAV